MNQYGVIINKLTQQIGDLSKDNAVIYSLLVEAQEENKKLKDENEKLKVQLLELNNKDE